MTHLKHKNKAAAQRTSRSRILSALLCLTAVLLFQACSHHVPIKPETPFICYRAAVQNGDALERLAPVFQAWGADKAHNRIGRPKAFSDANGKPQVYTDSGEPFFFVRQTQFSTSKGDYTNLVYRIHFSKIPYSLIPFTLTAGKNAGLLVVITLNQEERPVLVTTVHTCGCYLSIIPTTHLPKECLPEGWEDAPQRVYGETHPALLHYSPDQGQRLLIELRPEIHRVMNVRAVNERELDACNDSLEEAPIIAADSLRELEIAGGGSVSFFHESGVRKGFVKNSVKPWESLLMSWMALDLFVGSDKAYSDSMVKDNPFYTSLKPWNRQKSNMLRFADFLRFWGYDL
ncbi:conserved hypothetical protein [Desulfatibacillum aliphaticivorans]|uniref:Uncharacterized protein n=1 Tax=Desulfatibacillum aliphaticivorans TaxID=218208 RepID=B8FG56_DESAL|nr:hypothetical protein [Desulfatibacillum aliphaticivorans]ACL03736.1 conserved hypothetical protein [Desulfatibacillum aliphaticivorans]